MFIMFHSPVLDLSYRYIKIFLPKLFRVLFTYFVHTCTPCFYLFVYSCLFHVLLLASSLCVSYRLQYLE